jgi:outer membrane protein OmpA-like peptidoglycan-associated protein
MKNEMESADTRSELLRELVIGTALVAMVMTAVGGLYWMHSAPDEAMAGSAVAVASKPAEAKPKTTLPAPDDAVVHADIYFDFKSVRLRADAARMLQDKASVMTRTATWAVLVTGYTDRQGPALYNKTLALRRADAVKQFLIELGVPESSIKVVALGPDAALCDDPGKECQQLNRRAHLEIRRLGPVATVSATPVSGAPLTARPEDVQTR